MFAMLSPYHEFDQWLGMQSAMFWPLAIFALTNSAGAFWYHLVAPGTCRSHWGYMIVSGFFVGYSYSCDPQSLLAHLVLLSCILLIAGAACFAWGRDRGRGDGTFQL